MSLIALTKVEHPLISVTLADVMIRYNLVVFETVTSLEDSDMFAPAVSTTDAVLTETRNNL